MIIDKRVALFLELPKRYTLWTFIKYYERSKDPAHCRRVKKAMTKALETMPNISRCRSVMGGRSYRRYVGDVPF